MTDFNVLNFDAGPDCPDNAPAFQRAINAAAANGGGRVVVPPGDYRLDMVSLKDNVELHLEQGARLNSILEPVPDPKETCPEPSCNSHRYLLGGVGLHHAAITGTGIIDGRGQEKFWIIEPGREYPLFGQRYWPKLHRPKGLLHFRDSGDITITGVTILNPPAYTVWLLGCDTVTIAGVKIDSPLSSPNTDGLDIDCCRNVHIDNCDITAGDDAIALKSDIYTLGRNQACENVTVTNCRLKTSSCGIRVGYEGDGAIRNCIFSNCIIYDSMIGISMMVALDPYNQRGVVIEHGPHIHDILFTDLVVNAWQTFNFQHLKLAEIKMEGILDQIVIRNILASARRGSYIGGLPGNPIGYLEFSGITMMLSGPMNADFLKTVPEPYPIWNDLEYCGIPWAIYARQVRSLTLRDSSFRWHNATGVWQNALHTYQVDTVRTSNLDEFRDVKKRNVEIAKVPVGCNL